MTQDKKHIGHTPGPWGSFFRGVASTPDFVIKAGDQIICTLPETTTKTASEVSENARLIASAPETAKERDELKTEKEKYFKAFINEVQKTAFQGIEIERLKALNSELLEACNEVLNEWHSKPSNFKKKEPKSLEMIRKAIAKAEGK